MRLDIKILHIRIELEWIELFTAGIYLYTLCKVRVVFTAIITINTWGWRVDETGLNWKRVNLKWFP